MLNMKKINLYCNKSRREISDMTTTTSSTSRDEETEWEMRPGGMLVQKRTQNTADIPSLICRLRVAFGLLRYEVSVDSRASFGEVKKLLEAETGLQSGDQRLIFRGKEREDKEYLDTCRVKNKSKLILMEDPTSIERRYIDVRRNAKIQTAYRAILDVSMEVDKLVEQVDVLERTISNGGKVPELQVTTLIEMLMRQAIKLEAISDEGEASVQKILQGKRIQNCVENLDAIMISNDNVKPLIVTTTWETFESPPSPSPPTTTTSSSWEFFD